MTLRLDAHTAELVAVGHDLAASTIDGSAAGAPRGVDAGYGTAHVTGILAAVTGTAAEISQVNRGIARLVREAASDLGRTESQIAHEFDTMRGVG